VGPFIPIGTPFAHPMRVQMAFVKIVFKMLLTLPIRAFFTCYSWPDRYFMGHRQWDEDAQLTGSIDPTAWVHRLGLLFVGDSKPSSFSLMEAWSGRSIE
jgi:hypothetical protein